jgi:hypothetical protein
MQPAGNAHIATPALYKWTSSTTLQSCIREVMNLNLGLDAVHPDWRVVLSIPPGQSLDIAALRPQLLHSNIS